MNLPPPRWRRRLRRVLVLAGVLAALYATRGWTLPAWGRWLDVSEPARPADFAYVLGGGVESRPFVAAGLYKRGHVGGVLVPTLAPDPESPPDAGEDLTHRILTSRGVPAGRVVTLPGEVHSTFDEAEALARFLDEHPGATVIVVTDDYHTRRARRVFRRVLGERAGQLQFVGTPVDGVSAANWWTTPTGFHTYVGETLKAGYYAIRY